VESWLAEDVASGEKVFVKLADPGQVGLSNRLRIAHECRILHQLRSSSLAKLLCFGETEEQVYLVTEYVPGENLEQVLSQGPLEQSSTVSVAIRLLEALEEIHGQNILHRDIKPSNIKVPSPDRATLVDFGLSRSPDSQTREVGQVTGSLLYMAPEQLGLLSREISPATDLYSLGVVLYECLAGKPPFWSESLAELLRKHLTQAPQPLGQFRPDVSQRFERFIQRLLKKEPQERFVTAKDALVELQAFRDRIEGEQKLVTSVGPQGFRQVHAPFVGRLEQKKRLDSALDETLAGRSSTIGICGVAGSGKTRLLDYLALQAVEKGFSVYRGRAQAEQSSGPFSLLGGIVDKIAVEINRNRERLDSLRASLGKQASVLAATFPSLRSLSGSLNEEEPSPWLDSKVLRALRSLFQQISVAGRPALVIMDDLHWTDAATRRFIIHWNKELEQSNGWYTLLAVGTRPSVEVVEVRSSCKVEVELPPFTEEEVEELFDAFGSTIGVSELAILKELTAGNPLMVVETVRELSSTAKNKSSTLSQKLVGLRAQGLFAGRIGRVSEPTRRFLRLAAQLGQSFQPLGLGHAAGMDSTKVFECLSEARAESIVWEDATTGKYYFLHDRMRQHLSEELEVDEKADLHLRYAQYLSEEMPDSHYELAFHFHLAGVHEQASAHAEVAARTAFRRNALESAKFYFQIAMKDPQYAKDGKLCEELADCCMLLGEYPRALELYQETYEQAVENLDQARLLGKLGELHQKMGRVGEASEAILEAIRRLGGRVPTTALGRRLETAWRLAVELLKPSESHSSRRESGCPKSLLLAHLYCRLSYVWFWTHGQADLLFIHLRHLQEAARHPKSKILARAYTLHAIACLGANQKERAHRFAQQSLELYREMGDAWGEAHAHNTLGLVLYAASRVDECIEVVQRAETQLDAAGDLWELAVCRYNLALCYYRKGQLPRAREPAKRAYAVGLECGDVQASGVSLGVLVRCSPLEISEAQLDRELQAQDLDAATKAWLLEAKGIRWLALGQAGKAVEELEESWAISSELGRRTEYVASSPCWLATAYRKHLEALTPFATEERQKLLRKLDRTVKLALDWAKNFRNNLAHALREDAYLQALRGRPRRSLASLRKSLEVAEEMGFLQELALTTEAQLRLKGVLNLSQEEIGRFNKPLLDYGKLLDYGSPQSVSHSERFGQVLAVAAKLTKADSYEAVFGVMEESAGALFRTEDCLVLERLEDDRITVVGEGRGEAVSHTLARHAMDVGVPVTSVDDLPLTESLMMAEIRSALCVPFGSTGSRRCCVQITHRLVSQIFAEEEIRVASYLSSLGTAALESVATTEAVREAEELEQQRKKQLELLEARREGLLQSLGIASHDLKNLIFLVECVSRGLVNAKGQKDLERAQEYLQLVCRKANWMVCIYLDITQAHKTGSIPCQASLFDLAKLGQDVSDFLNSSLTLESQQPRIEFQGESLMVNGDEDRLWQAVANIVSNALIHTPLGSPVRVEVVAEGDRGLLSVVDQGAGISPEIQQSIFDPFVQAKRDSKGSGLGLWIAKLIVESSGGTLELQTELGKGSVFRISLQTAESDRL
jgi:serine/threonine protein kinase/signal transduction histidine kinase